MTKDTESKHSESFVCLQEGTSKQLKKDTKLLKTNQNTILEKINGFEQTLGAFKLSQSRMFEMIKNLSEKSESINEELKRGTKHFTDIESTLREKGLTNGFRDKEIEKLEKDSEEIKKELVHKISRKELDERIGVFTNKMDDLIKTTKDNTEIQEQFNNKLYKLFTVAFIVIGGIVGIITLILRL
jgi:chromosome segregation ATPase